MASTQSTLYYFLEDLVSILEAFELTIVSNTNKEVEGKIKHIDLYHGQDERPQDEQSFARPAALIEFQDAPWPTTKHTTAAASNRTQEKQGTMTFAIHLLFSKYDKEIERYFKTDKFRQALDKSIEGKYNPDRAYGTIKKVRDVQQINDSLEWHWVYIYEVPLAEEGVSRKLVTKTGVDLELNVTIEKQS